MKKLKRWLAHWIIRVGLLVDPKIPVANNVIIAGHLTSSQDYGIVARCTRLHEINNRNWTYMGTPEPGGLLDPSRRQ